MAYAYLDLKKDDTFIEKQYKRIPLGFSYTVLFFGALVSISRQDNVGFLLLAGLEFAVFSIAGTIFQKLDFPFKFIIILLSLRILLGCVYNYFDLKRLIFKGYAPYKIISDKHKLNFEFKENKLRIIKG